jgi:peptide-methionine (R)-S-oxide reductase
MKVMPWLVLIFPLLAGCDSSGPQQTVSLIPTEAPQSETSAMVDKVVHTEEEWKQRLTPEQYYVLRQKGTERPFANEFDDHFAPGTYSCAACGQELFASETKFNSGCGWPAFYAAKAGDRVKLTPDYSHGMVRTEVTCSRCDSHLGHVFEDAPQTPTGHRFCINSVSLVFTPAAGGEEVAVPPAE